MHADCLKRIENEMSIQGDQNVLSSSKSHFDESLPSCSKDLDESAPETERNFIDFRTMDAGNTEEDGHIDRTRLIDDILEETILRETHGEIPAYIPSVFKTSETSEAFKEEMNDLGCDVPDLSRYDMEQALNNFCKKHESFLIHTSPSLHGRLIYSINWDIVYNLYTKAQKDVNKTSDIKLDQSQERNIRAEEMFHSIAEIRRRLKDGSKICDQYAKYPELLSSLLVEDLIFTGAKVRFVSSEKVDFISPMDPLLFNL